MLKLKGKRCVMGVINNRVEKHGEDDVTAFDIPLDALLKPAELDSLVPLASRVLFNTKGSVQEPAFPDFAHFPLRHDLAAKAATLEFGSNVSTDYAIEFEEVTLKGLVLEPLIGGETGLKFKLQVRPQNKHITRLLNAQNTSVKLTVGDLKIAEKAARKQQALPLAAPGESNGEAAPAAEPAARRRDSGDASGADLRHD